MRKTQKRQIEETIRQMEEAHGEMKRYIEKGIVAQVEELLADCQNAAVAIGTLIENTEGEEHPAVTVLEEYCELVYQIYEYLSSDGSVNANKIYKSLRQKLIKASNSIRNDIKIRTEAVFLPYKASMWDSLESVWKAADADPDCDAYVIPIPYFDKNPDGSFKEEHYEGNQYPNYVPITRYDAFDFGKHMPDVIYIHNAYDDWNLVTSVHPDFYSRNLKNYTEELVYIPYFVLGEIDPNDEQVAEGMKHFCFMPGIINADKVIVQSEDMKKIYIREYLKAAKKCGLTGKHLDRAYLDKKFLGTGSPKIDKLLNTKKEDLDIPAEWLKIIEKPDGSWKKIVFYNTSVGALLQYSEKMLRKMESVFDIFRENKDELALLWRPHPLIQATIESMRPQLWKAYQEIRDRYVEEGWGIYDDSADLDRAVVLSDAYYGDGSSVVELCREKEMPVMVQNVNVFSKQHCILLSTYNLASTENSIYFAAKNIMGFFEYDKRTKRTRQIAFDAFEMGGDLISQFAFGGTCLYRDKVLFGPFVGSKALIYSTDEKWKAQIIDIKRCVNRKRYNYYFIKRAVALDNLIYLIGDLCTDILVINMDTMRINVLDSWKMQVPGGMDCIGANTRWDACVVDGSLFVPINCSNCILEINMKTQETTIHKINSEKMLFSTICFDGIDFWLTGSAMTVVKWNKADNKVEMLVDFPEKFQRFDTEIYGNELFSRSCYENGYVYLFPLTVNMILKINTRTGKMESLHQWNTLKCCYTVEKWDTELFYIETLDGDYNDIDESMLMDMEGNVVERDIFTFFPENLHYIFPKKKHSYYIETSAFMLVDFLERHS